MLDGFSVAVSKGGASAHLGECDGIRRARRAAPGQRFGRACAKSHTEIERGARCAVCRRRGKAVSPALSLPPSSSREEEEEDEEDARSRGPLARGDERVRGELVAGVDGVPEEAPARVFFPSKNSEACVFSKQGVSLSLSLALRSRPLAICLDTYPENVFLGTREKEREDAGEPRRPLVSTVRSWSLEGLPAKNQRQNVSIARVPTYGSRRAKPTPFKRSTADAGANEGVVAFHGYEHVDDSAELRHLVFVAERHKPDEAQRRPARIHETVRQVLALPTTRHPTERGARRGTPHRQRARIFGPRTKVSPRERER